MQRLWVLAGAAALALTATTTLAQEDKAKAKAPAAPRTAISIECSKQADSKGLHGKARHSFRSKCKRDGAKAAKSKT